LEGITLNIIVDADACPKSCLQLIQKHAPVYGYVVITIASFNHVISNENHIVVGNEPQAADIAVVNHTKSGDIVVTQDWGLAAMILAKKAQAISPRGRIFSEDKIDCFVTIRNGGFYHQEFPGVIIRKSRFLTWKIPYELKGMMVIQSKRALC
jgi:uncharacterized protein YaiI (UPF0178 family)